MNRLRWISVVIDVGEDIVQYVCALHFSEKKLSMKGLILFFSPKTGDVKFLTQLVQ